MDVLNIHIPQYGEYASKTASKKGVIIHYGLLQNPEVMDLLSMPASFALLMYLLLKANPTTKSYEVEQNALKEDLKTLGFTNLKTNFEKLTEAKVCIITQLQKTQLTLFPETDGVNGTSAEQTKAQLQRTHGYNICRYFYDLCKELHINLASHSYHQNANVFVELVKEYGPKEVRASVQFFLSETYWKENITGAYNIKYNFHKFHSWYLKTVKMPYPKDHQGRFCTNEEKLLYPADDPKIPYKALNFQNQERRLKTKGLLDATGIPIADTNQRIPSDLAQFVYLQYTEKGKHLDPLWEPFYQAVLRDYASNDNNEAQG